MADVRHKHDSKGDKICFSGKVHIHLPNCGYETLRAQHAEPSGNQAQDIEVYPVVPADVKFKCPNIRRMDKTRNIATIDVPIGVTWLWIGTKWVGFFLAFFLIIAQLTISQYT